MSHEQIGCLEKALEIPHRLLPWLGQARHSRGNAIDDLGGVALHGQQKGLLGENGPGRNREQNHPQLETLIQLRIQSRRLGVDDQQRRRSCRPGIRVGEPSEQIQLTRGEISHSDKPCRMI